MDLFNQLGELALGSRLRRLSDNIMNQAANAYTDAQIDFDPKWFPVYYLLSTHATLSITEISTLLGISHPAVIKNARELEKKGYLISAKDPKDKRRRMLSLSADGQALLPKIQVVWGDMATAVSELLQAQDDHLMNAVSQVEQAFRQKPFTARVRKSRDTRLLQAIEIVNYKSEYAAHFKSLNYHWIEKYFTVEPIDIQALENHQEKIISPGGCILFAKLNGNIVGTCALKKTSPDCYELTKMAVAESAQGKQVGKKLGQAIIAKAKQIGSKMIFLESNRKLVPAIQLYLKLGFVEAPYTTNQVSEYQRADIRMELKLD